MLGALLAPCGAGAAVNVQQYKCWAPGRVPAPRKKWTDRAARSYPLRACEASGGRLVTSAPRDDTQNPSPLCQI